MGYVEGVERTQATLFPASLEEYVTAENPVRFIDAFVAGLDLEELGFKRAVPAETGRPGYDPADLLRLYLYGYLNRVRSSRRLEGECQRNVEVMWLIGKRCPDHKTIADFRKDNGEGLRRVCREFTVICRQLELFGGELVGIDGSVFKAVNSRQRNYTRAKIARALRRIEEHVAQYLAVLDTNDAAAGGGLAELTAQALQEKIERLRSRQQQYRALEQELATSGVLQISLTDTDSRLMAREHDCGTVGSNAQIAVDGKHKLIVAHEVTNAVTDRDQLSRMATQAKEVLGGERLDVVADMGYAHGKEIKACVAHGITPYVPQPHTSANTKLGLFGKERFSYDAAQDCYWCPAGAALAFRFQTRELGRDIRYYTTQACRTCTLKARCTRNKESRRITRWVDEHLLEAMAHRVVTHPEVMRQRKQLVEHPFGVIKHVFGYAHFLMRRLPQVRTEMSLAVMAFNLRRVINILGVPRLLAAVA